MKMNFLSMKNWSIAQIMAKTNLKILPIEPKKVDYYAR